MAKKKDISDHEKSKKHTSKANLNASSNKEVLTKFITNGSTKVKELRLAAFIAEHTSNRCVDHLGELLKSLDPKMDIKLHRTKCSNLITHVLAPELKKEMIADIGCRPFSIIIDESNDMSNIKCLGIVIRYISVSRKKIIDTMYALLSLEEINAVGITRTLLNCLKEDKLDIKKLIGIGVDGASTMVGEWHSVSTLLMQEVGSHMITNRCICHSLALAASKATETLPRNLDFMIKETCSWFNHSHSRRLKYARLYEEISREDGGPSDPIKLSFVSMTRWLARRNIIGKILQQWEPLKQHFDCMRHTEKCYTAELLYHMYNDMNNRLYLVFLFSALDDVCRVNATFQAKNPNPIAMIEDLIDLYMGLLKRIVVPGRFIKVSRTNCMDFDFEQYIMPTSAVNFGYEFRSVVAIESTTTAEVKERCKACLVSLTKEVKKRLPSNFKLLLSIKCFEPRNAMNSFSECPVESLENFKCFVESIDSCIKEWGALSTCTDLIDYCRINKDTLTAERFWFQVLDQVDACGNPKFKNIVNLALSWLTLPLTNASVERLFSIMNLVKCKARNRLLVSNTEKIMLVRQCLENVRNETCVTFVPSQAMLIQHNSAVLYSKEAEFVDI